MGFRMVFKGSVGGIRIIKSPYVRFSKSGHIWFSKGAVEAVGSKNRFAEVLFDKDKWRVGFIFDEFQNVDAYCWTSMGVKTNSRCLSVKSFTKAMGILNRVANLNQYVFPLQLLGEAVPGFEGRTVWVVDLQREE